MSEHRTDRTSRLRWWVYVIPALLFLLGILIGALLW
jgi:uncharacterized membrane protein YoaK (UPF0700 family)